MDQKAQAELCFNSSLHLNKDLTLHSASEARNQPLKRQYVSGADR